MGNIALFRLFLFHSLLGISAAVTIYYAPGQNPFSTTSADASSYTGAAAYNPTTIDPPALPDPLPSLSLDFNIQSNPTGLSITQSGAFMGFSVEMSVANQICESILQVPFLNLLATIAQRAGAVRVRVGGNSQDTASEVSTLDDGKVLEKDLSGVTNPTETPPLVFTPDLLYMMRNISDFVNVRWFVGIPFNDSSNFRLEIAQSAQEILGDYLMGVQAGDAIGNEPDLYAAHGHRSSSYSQYDYVGELGSLIDDMSQYSNLSIAQNLLLIPSVSGTWTPEEVWDTGVMDTYGSNIAWMSVEHYPTDNCYAQFGTGTPRNATELWPTYLMHSSAQSLVQPYLNSTTYAQTKGKPFIMFETNTASCGFPGISDVFGAALWGLDYGLLMAASNFSGGMFHVGGESVYYNVAPPTNQSSYREWTVGPVFYSSLVIAEALGPSNQSQVLEVGAENQSTYTPNYVIYENGQPVRMVLINFLSDSSGNSNYTANIAIGGGQTGQSNTTPSQVTVKYLTASSVSQKGNYSWAGQTFGGNFDSDGRLEGTESIQTIPCDQSAQTCSVSVPAPGAALVFLTNELTETEGAPSTTFATTTVTNTGNTATVDASVLATSNGRNGNSPLGSSSKGSANGGVVSRESIAGLLLRVGSIGALGLFLGAAYVL
ncbi:glycoside hydrolase family 79 protein [Lentinula aff. lateritia]|uniref:Glycoside hydrolase family 79 protein n=1 Tax=Lentinula aff. lateritia TaxID=2804960 RepID=A0ACC1U001_9AGAR|nr:glycoside hydrolase family 79 protein [Lentinula aff. lateritia]